MTEQEKRELILSKCPNYDSISNYVYLATEDIVKVIIESYQDYVFSIDIDNKEELHFLEQVNYTLDKFMADFNFAKALKEYVVKHYEENKTSLTKELMQMMVEFTSHYEEESLKHISNTVWF